VTVKTGIDPWHRSLKIDGPSLLKVMGPQFRASTAQDLSHNPHSTEINPRFPPCQIYRRWMASIQQPQP